ncbi:retrovirus-related pol polyprotein from transposon TNT 1-94, partial [Tanacetum coccineum]
MIILQQSQAMDNSVTGKNKKSSHPPKVVPSNHSKLELLHMDLCGPMRVASINGKKYILVIVNYNAKVHKIRTDNDTEFKNETLKAHYEKLGIMQQFSIAQTPQQNGIFERRNHTLVEAARTLLIFSRLPEFIWAEAVSTACFTQNQSIIHTRYNKTPYELLHSRKPNVEYFHVFGSLCYPANNRDDLGKMKPKADIGIFIGYSETSRGFRTYNRQTKKIMETIHVKFDELTTIGSEHGSLEPVSINSATQQVHNHEDSSSTSSILVEEHEVPPIVTISEEQTSPISINEADEFNQEDSTEFDGNIVLTPYAVPKINEAESSFIALDPSNMH